MYRVLCSNSGFYAKEIDIQEEEELNEIQECVSGGDIFILVDDIEYARDFFGFDIEIVSCESEE